jgi:hypothetical protein
MLNGLPLIENVLVDERYNLGFERRGERIGMGSMRAVRGYYFAACVHDLVPLRCIAEGDAGSNNMMIPEHGKYVSYSDIDIFQRVSEFFPNGLICHCV